MLLAYVQDQLATVSLEEQLKSVESYNYQLLYIDKARNKQQPFVIIEQMEPQDTFLIHQLACLGLPLRSLAKFLKEMQRRQLSFISIQDQLQIDEFQKESLFLDHLDLLIKIDKQVRSKRTMEGFEKLKREGKPYGRPAIIKQKVNQIIRLHEQNYTYREIAMICEVSIGVVHKYIKKENEKNIPAK